MPSSSVTGLRKTENAKRVIVPDATTGPEQEATTIHQRFWNEANMKYPLRGQEMGRHCPTCVGAVLMFRRIDAAQLQWVW
jgi:hypothetical protein